MNEEETSQKILDILTEEDFSFGQVAGILENIKFVMWIAHVQANREQQK